MPVRPYHAYTVAPRAPRTWSVTARVTQPGFASWWRLAAPGLRWARTHAGRLTWACFGGASIDPLDPRKRHLPRPTLFALPHRERLITVTRGPMARKKQSRVQLLMRRQVVCLESHDTVRPTPIRAPGALRPLVASQRALAHTWSQPLGAPFTLVGARVSWPVTAPALLVWR